RAPAAHHSRFVEGGTCDVSDPSPDSTADFPALRAYLDPVCARFEEACRGAGPTGTLPRLEEYLGATPPPDRAVLLQELVALELAYRRRRGEIPEAAAYLARFADLNPAWLEREFQAATTVVKDGSPVDDAMGLRGDAGPRGEKEVPAKGQ